MSLSEGQRSDTSFIRVLRTSSLWDGILWRGVASHMSYNCDCITHCHKSHDHMRIKATDSSHTCSTYQSEHHVTTRLHHMTVTWQPDSITWPSHDNQTLSHDSNVTTRLTLAMHMRWELSEPAGHIFLSALQSGQETPDRHTTQQATAAKQTALVKFDIEPSLPSIFNSMVCHKISWSVKIEVTYSCRDLRLWYLWGFK